MERLNAERANTEKARVLARRHIEFAQLLCERGEIGSGMLWLAHSLQVAPADSADLHQAARANLTAWRPHLHSLRAVLRHKSEVKAVAFSPDDSLILTATSAGVAQLWDADTGKPIGRPMQHEGTVGIVTFSPDGSRILTRSRTTDKTSAATRAIVGCPHLQARGRPHAAWRGYGCCL